MGDDQRGAKRHQLAQRFLDLDFRLRVDRGRGFVQHQDRRVLQKHAGDGQPVSLAAGEFHPALPDQCFVSLGQLLDELVRMRRASRPFHLSAVGVQLAVQNVFLHRAVEQKRLLRHQSHLLPQIRQAQFPEGVPVDANLSVIGVIKPHEQFDEGGFAASGMAHQRHFLSRPEDERHLMQNLLGGHVGKIHRVKNDFPMDRGRGMHGVGVFDHVRLRVDDLEQPIAGSQRVLEHMVQGVQLVDRRVEQAQVPDKCNQCSHGDLLRLHQADAIQDDRNCSQRTHEHHRRGVHRPQAHHFQGALAVIAAPLLEPLHLVALAVEGEGFLDPGDGVLQDAVHFGGAFPHLVVQAVRPHGILPRADHQKGNGNKGRHRQLPVQVEQDDHDADQGQCGGDDLLHTVDENPFDMGDVVVDAGHDLAGRPVLEIIER